MFRDKPGFFTIAGVTGLLCLFMGFVFLTGEFSTAISVSKPVTIEVRAGESLVAVTRRLAREGILSGPRFFQLLAVLRGDTGRVKAGDYVVEGVVSPNDLLDYLVSGRAQYVALTVPEGFSLRDIAQRLSENKIADGEAFLRLATDPGFVSSLGLSIPKDFSTIEGFVFPDTYFFHRGMQPSQLITMMTAQFRQKTAGILEKNAARTGLTPYQALILASIIEKETGLGSERRLISAVFHNRLKTGMSLGSDPTVIYGIKDFDGNLTRSHLRQETPYNTYRIKGLPPTPIANPGLESLQAAVNPEDADFLYFVAKGDGSHFFSKNLKTHNQAVWKYQKNGQRKPRS